MGEISIGRLIDKIGFVGAADIYNGIGVVAVVVGIARIRFIFLVRIACAAAADKLVAVSEHIGNAFRYIAAVEIVVCIDGGKIDAITEHDRCSLKALG